MTNRNLGIAAVVIIIIALGVWGVMRMRNSSQTNDQTNNQSANNTPANNVPADNVPANNAPTNNSPTTMNGCTRNFDSTKLSDTITLKNQFVTLDVKNFGTIKLQLFDQDAPKAAENFLRLAHAGYYDCLTFHRVAQGFVVQGGDPNGDGTGGQSAFGAAFADELNANAPSFKTGYIKGTLAMANSGPNTNGSQFFITLADLNANLPKNYTIFGKVVSGQDVVDKIGKVDINPGPFGATDGMPKVPVVITKATISSK